jgi:malonyl-CoA/methylmalonyl-CoA synthetase
MPSPPGSIVAAFLAHAESAPDKPCLLFEDESWNYARLRTEALRWAGAYRAAGVQPGDRVALFLENSPSFVTAYLGAHLAGAILVAVNTQYRQVELRHILSDAGVRLCVTDTPRRAELARVRADLPELTRVVTVEVDDRMFLGRADPCEPKAPDPEDVALIGYTSGTTGRAKGAMLLHRNLAANAWAVTTAWGWTAADRLLLTLPLFHAHGLCVGLNGTLFVGATADLRRKFEAAEVLDALTGGEATMFFGVPTMYTRLIAEAEKRGAVSSAEGGRPRPLRLYVSGSAPLSVQTFEQFERLFGQPILERYGMTETIMNLTNPYHGERRPGTVGVPFPGQEARIVDVQTGQPIDDERPGEIQVRGPHVFKGYWRNPEATAEAFDPSGPLNGGWFNTGDLGWRSRDGYYTISGRARELIISGGFNIYPREVEEVLQSHPAVAEAAVLGLPDPDFGEQVVAALVLRPGAAATADELVAHCRDQLASYKKPRQLFFVESLPRNALGKIQKHLLREQLSAG